MSGLTEEGVAGVSFDQGIAQLHQRSSIPILGDDKERELHQGILESI